MYSQKKGTNMGLFWKRKDVEQEVHYHAKYL